ncbi:MAG: glycosyl transferase [Hydrocarboniphaga sp.]|uniref:glycosyltransferase n=1 Tax=Hydrocarboniphaga sp. TaxID=2033016 RepID=UPI00262D0367|nr:glycosyltransferase [Hydrocarboniphaga sp.]MDB5969469.1 glycosyl transferase [Hydrocarboniphaga sp.]
MTVTGPAAPRIALFMSTSGHSGVDRAIRHLAPALAGRGYAVDLLKVRRHGPELAEIPPGVRVIDLGASSTYGALPALIRYLRRERPAVLLSDKDRVNRTALLARWLSGVSQRTRLVLSSGTTISVDLAHRGAFERWIQRWSMGNLYPLADQVIVTCKAVAADMAAYTGLARARIRAVFSPVVPASLFESRPPPPDHPWFAPGAPPVLVGVGELAPRKDFPTLIRAFAQLRRGRELRLMIVGKGRDHLRLQTLCDELGVSGDVEFVGFRRDVYAFMAHAAVFAMTSRWEGLGFVLIEALACGTPCVAVDCPSGPAEVLGQGRYGQLVPIGDAGRLAAAIGATLDDPPSPEQCRAAAKPYEIEQATNDYLRAMNLPAFATEVR